MALSANTVLEVRTDGDDLNGGGFVAGAAGTDRSQQAAPHVTINGTTITATVHTTTTQLTLVGYTVSAADVGNLVRISGGTATAGVYEITAVDVPNNRWTLDASAGTAAQTATGRMGGALGSPGRLSTLMTVSGMKAWIKSGTYTCSTTTPGAGGPFALTSALNFFVRGYQTTRGDRAARPLLSAGSQSGITLWNMNTNRWSALENVEADGNSQASVIGFGANIRDGIRGCKASNCTTGFSATTLNGCEAVNCTTGIQTSAGSIRNCRVSGGVTGITLALYVDECLVTGCSGVGIALTSGSSQNVRLTRSTVSGCGSHGVTAVEGLVIDCVLTHNGGAGVSGSGSTFISVINCFGFSNAGGNLSGPLFSMSDMTALSADPFIDRVGGDYRLNGATGGGLALRGAGTDVPGQNDSRDVGAVQTSGGGLMLPLGFNGGFG